MGETQRIYVPPVLVIETDKALADSSLPPAHTSETVSASTGAAEQLTVPRIDYGISLQSLITRYVTYASV